MRTNYSTVLFLGLIVLSFSMNHKQTSETKPTSSAVTKIPDGWGVGDGEVNPENITNLNALNWIIGDQTIDNYNNQLFKFITNNNITKCPIQTPFLRDSKCISCTGDKPVFDLKQSDCTSCPQGTKLDTSTHTCVTFKNKCSGNYIWSQTQIKCICPDAFPIDLGCQCVTCLQPFTWNTNESVCKLRCEQSHIWNKDKQICECPKQAPYQVKGECIVCRLPFEWKSGTCTLKVENCNAPSVSTTPSTQTKPSNTSTTPSTTPNSKTCSSNYVWDQNVKKCVCPGNLFFNDGTKCVECNLPKYWDHDLKQCLSCPTGKYFSTISRNCEDCPSDKPLARNGVCEACPYETTYSSSSNTCQQSSAAINAAPIDSTYDEFAPTAVEPEYSTQTYSIQPVY